MIVNNQSMNDKQHQRSEAEALFISEFADIQYEDLTTLVSTLEHLNLEHVNLEP